MAKLKTGHACIRNTLLCNRCFPNPELPETNIIVEKISPVIPILKYKKK